ncbi:MAG: putative oxidoreductase [Bradymonadia bacterium]|jgi:putative oxidoreductase
MLFHGIDKITGGIGWMPGALEAQGVPGFVAYGAYIGEVVAPPLMVFGLAMRTSAATITFTMLMAV